MTESLTCTANFQSVTKLEGVPFEPDHVRAQALTLERFRFPSVDKQHTGGNESEPQRKFYYKVRPSIA